MSHYFKNIYATFDRFIRGESCTVGVECTGMLYPPVRGSWDPDSPEFGPDEEAHLEIHEIKFKELTWFPDNFPVDEVEKELENLKYEDLDEYEEEQLQDNLFEEACADASEVEMGYY